MATLTKFIRLAAGRVPQLRTTLPTVAGVTRMQGFSSTSSPRAEQDEQHASESSGLKDIGQGFIEAGEEAAHTTVQRKIKPLEDKSFIQPSDLTRGARMPSARKFFTKRPFLGPGRREAEENDIFRQLDIDPVAEVANSTLLLAFVTDMGKIRSRASTGLTWRSQRKVGKAVRRARMMGIIPQLSKKILTSKTSLSVKSKYKKL